MKPEPRSLEGGVLTGKRIPETAASAWLWGLDKSLFLLATWILLSLKGKHLLESTVKLMQGLWGKTQMCSKWPFDHPFHGKLLRKSEQLVYSPVLEQIVVSGIKHQMWDVVISLNSGVIIWGENLLNTGTVRMWQETRSVRKMCGLQSDFPSLVLILDCPLFIVCPCVDMYTLVCLHIYLLKLCYLGHIYAVEPM